MHRKATTIATGLLLCVATPVAANAPVGGGVVGLAPAQAEMTDDGPVLFTPARQTLYYNSNENMQAEKFAWSCTNKAALTQSDEQSGVGVRPVVGAKFQKSCIDKFPPYLAGADAAAVGDFTIAQRPDGGRQWAYRGYPLYTSVRDRQPGERNAIGAGGFGFSGSAGGSDRFPGFRYATQKLDYPPGLKLMRRESGLVMAQSGEDRPVYTPKGKAKARIGDFDPILAPELASVVGDDWSIVDAGAGRRQFAFKGQPLFAAPAGASEDDVAAAGGWSMVTVHKTAPPPPAIGKRMSLLGNIYTDRNGRTLYLYNCTAGGQGGPGRGAAVACDGAGDPAGYMVALCGSAAVCAQRWHPYLAPANAKPSADWSTVEITYPMFTDPRGALYPEGAPRVRAWAFHGRPVFTYYEDQKPGDIWGDATKGLWGSSFNAIQETGRNTLFE